MNAPVESPPRTSSTRRAVRAIAARVLTMGVLVFLALWLMAACFGYLFSRC